MKKMHFGFIFLLITLSVIPHSFATSPHAGTQYTITPIAKAPGTISPNTALVVNSGDNLTFMASAMGPYKVYRWLLDGQLKQFSGITFTINNIQANHQVEVSFINGNMIYAGGANGLMYFSFNNGAIWNFTATPPNKKNPLAKFGQRPPHSMQMLRVVDYFFQKIMERHGQQQNYLQMVV